MYVCVRTHKGNLPTERSKVSEECQCASQVTAYFQPDIYSLPTSLHLCTKKKKKQPLFWTPVGETAQSYYKVKQRKGSACRLAQVIDDQTKANRNPTWAQTAHVGLWDAMKKIKTIFNGGNRINCTIFQTLSIFTEYCQTIFPLILPPHLSSSLLSPAHPSPHSFVLTRTGHKRSSEAV